MNYGNNMTMEIHEFIKDSRHETHRSPTIREIASGCFVSVGTVMRHLDKLEMMELIERNPKQARSILLTDSQK